MKWRRESKFPSWLRCAARRGASPPLAYCPMSCARHCELAELVAAGGDFEELLANESTASLVRQLSFKKGTFVPSQLQQRHRASASRAQRGGGKLKK